MQNWIRELQFPIKGNISAIGGRFRSRFRCIAGKPAMFLLPNCCPKSSPVPTRVINKTITVSLTPCSCVACKTD